MNLKYHKFTSVFAMFGNRQVYIRSHISVGIYIPKRCDEKEVIASKRDSWNITINLNTQPRNSTNILNLANHTHIRVTRGSGLDSYSSCHGFQISAYVLLQHILIGNGVMLQAVHLHWLDYTPLCKRTFRRKYVFPMLQHIPFCH